MHIKTFTTALATSLLIAGFAYAADIEIKMLNKGAKGVMVFEPDFVKAAPGDTIKFIAVDKGHDALAIKGMVPDGAELFKGEMSKDFVVTLTVEGIYGVKCAPHYGMGMVAMIVVGNPVNLEPAKLVKHAGKAKANFAALFEQLAAAK